jgi:hypothetical protein
MSKNKKSKPIPVRTPDDPETRHRRRKILVNLLGLVAFVAICWVSVRTMHEYVDKRVVFPETPPRVVLKDRPVWMSDLLAEQIVRMARPIGTHSTFDHQLLVTVTQTLEASPWVKKVRQVRRAYGERPGDTIEIDCEFRAPVALVRWRDYYWLVDGDGVKLPEQFTEEQLPRIVTGSNGMTNIRVVDGVRRPPVESGQTWPGDDLAAALDMIKLLHGQPYADAIVSVDVSNYMGRVDVREAQITLGTRYETQIRWGEPIRTPDQYSVEASPAEKLARLQQIHEKFGRIDGHQPWLDIRLDKITHPTPGLANSRG